MTDNIQEDIQNLKKAGDEILSETIDGYLLEKDKCDKAIEIFSKVIEYENDPEYKLKHDICFLYRRSFDNINLIAFGADKITQTVKEYIQNDESENDHNSDRIELYTILLTLTTRIMSNNEFNNRENIEVAWMYLPELIDIIDIATKYADDKRMNGAISFSTVLCEIALKYLSPSKNENTPKVYYEKISELGARLQEIDDRMGFSHIVCEEVMQAGNEKNKSEKKACYVATCVYGSYDCPQVWVLRRYRDYKLAKTWYGRLFISTYYLLSPTIVRIFGRTSIFKIIWRKFLDKRILKLKQKGYKDTPYDDNQAFNTYI